MKNKVSDSPKQDPGSRDEFRAALKGASPPPAWSAPFKAIWWEARGDWVSSHEVAQEIPTSWGSWMHAYLHRKEGDLWNAGYWYRKAGLPERGDSFEREFEDLLQALLDVDGNAV